VGELAVGQRHAAAVAESELFGGEHAVGVVKPHATVLGRLGDAEQAKVASDQAQEIDPDAVPPKEPARKWIEDQAQEILGQE